MSTQTAISFRGSVKSTLSVTAAMLLAGLSMHTNAATTFYSYDALHRLNQITYPDGTVITYTYDAAGNRIKQVISSASPILALRAPSAGAVPPALPSGTASATAAGSDTAKSLTPTPTVESSNVTATSEGVSISPSAAIGPINLGVGSNAKTRLAGFDINGDGKADLVFQNTAGHVSAWFLDGSGTALDFAKGSGLMPGSKLIYAGNFDDWRRVGMGDVNGDGKADLVFQNGAGQISAWFLDGTGAAVDFATGSGLNPGSKVLYPAGMGDSKVVGMGDLNGDGLADLVFQDGAGQNSAWFLDGGGKAVDFASGTGLKPGSKVLYPSGYGDWRVVGTGDVNGDGKADLVFQNAKGQISAWFMDGTGDKVDFATGSGLEPGSKVIHPGAMEDWKVGVIADFDRDGIADIVFQNAAGQIAIWFLDGTGAAVDLKTKTGLKPNSGIIYSDTLEDWRLR